MNDKGEMEKVMTSPVYRKDTIEEIFKDDKIGDIEERCFKFIDNFWDYSEKRMLEGSGWSFVYINGINFTMYDYDVIAGGKYIDLPKIIKNKRACINVNNKDNMCFKWAILSALHHKDIYEHSDCVTKYRQYENELNEEGVQYPVTFENKSMMLQVEDNNKLLITVLGLDQDMWEEIFSMMIHNADSDSHYIWVKNLSALLSGRDKIKYRENRNTV